MNSDTKLCPFCAEEINKDAIKCKHCKEFLNIAEKSTDTTFYPKSIATQNFRLAIGIAIISIILSILDNYFDSNDDLSYRLSIFSTIAEICVLFYFRKYLENFKADKAIIMVNWYIALTIILGLLSIITKAIPEIDTSDEWKNTDTIMLLSIIVMISFIIVSIKTGISLQKIKNDTVGLLKELGMALSYLLPITILFLFLLGIVGGVMENKTISTIASILLNVPTIIMIIIFLRAQNKISETTT